MQGFQCFIVLQSKIQSSDWLKFEQCKYTVVVYYVHFISCLMKDYDTVVLKCEKAQIRMKLIFLGCTDVQEQLK